jgi:hypothetical protein
MISYSQLQTLYLHNIALMPTNADTWRRSNISDKLEKYQIPFGYVNRTPEDPINARNGQL